MKRMEDWTEDASGTEETGRGCRKRRLKQSSSESDGECPQEQPVKMLTVICSLFVATFRDKLRHRQQAQYPQTLVY